MGKEVKLSELRIGVCLCEKKNTKNGRVPGAGIVIPEFEEAITKNWEWEWQREEMNKMKCRKEVRWRDGFERQ